jgi:hypothetical protein
MSNAVRRSPQNVCGLAVCSDMHRLRASKEAAVPRSNLLVAAGQRLDRPGLAVTRMSWSIKASWWSVRRTSPTCVGSGPWLEEVEAALDDVADIPGVDHVEHLRHLIHELGD